MTTSYMVYFVTMYFRPLDGYVSRNHNMEVRVGDVDAATDMTENQSAANTGDRPGDQEVFDVRFIIVLQGHIALNCRVLVTFRWQLNLLRLAATWWFPR